MVDRTEWTNRLEALHALRRLGTELAERDLAWYQAARAALLGSARATQNLAIPGDHRARRSLRLARAMPVEVILPGGKLFCMTSDFSAGGFAVVMDVPVLAQGQLEVTLGLPGERPVTVAASVAGVREEGRLHRTSFAFLPGDHAEMARLEDFILTCVLEQFVFWDDVFARLGA